MNGGVYLMNGGICPMNGGIYPMRLHIIDLASGVYFGAIGVITYIRTPLGFLNRLAIWPDMYTCICVWTLKSSKGP